MRRVMPRGEVRQGEIGLIRRGNTLPNPLVEGFPRQRHQPMYLVSFVVLEGYILRRRG